MFGGSASAASEGWAGVGAVAVGGELFLCGVAVCSAANGRATQSVSKTIDKVVLREIEPRRCAGLSNAMTRPSNCERLAMARAAVNSCWRNEEAISSNSCAYSDGLVPAAST
jgi:hypothetical protein